MLLVKLKVILQRRQARRRLARLERDHGARIQEVEANRKIQIAKLWKEQQRLQIEDLIVCIDFRLHLIRPLLPKFFIERINKNKQRSYRKKDLKQLGDLADAIWLSDIENLETEILKTIKLKKGGWFLWR